MDSRLLASEIRIFENMAVGSRHENQMFGGNSNFMIFSNQAFDSQDKSIDDFLKNVEET